MFCFKRLEFKGFEFVVDDASALPAHHVSARFAGDVPAQMFVRRPQYFLACGVQGAHNVERTTRGNNPIGARFHRSAGIGIDHHHAVRVCVTKCIEGVDGAT